MEAGILPGVSGYEVVGAITVDRGDLMRYLNYVYDLPRYESSYVPCLCP